MGLILFMGSGALLAVLQDSFEYRAALVGFGIPYLSFFGVFHLLGRFSEMATRHEIAMGQYNAILRQFRTSDLEEPGSLMP